MLQDLLKKLHFTPEEQQKIIEASKAESLPEGFNLDTITQSYHDRRKELAITAARPEIESNLRTQVEEATRKETYLATTKPLFNLVRQEGGFDKEELKELKPKEAIAKLIEKIKAESKTEQPTDEYKEKFIKLQDSYDELQTNYDKFKTDSVSQLEEEKNRATQTIEQFYINGDLDKIYRDKERIKFAYPDQFDNNVEIISRDLKEHYLLKREEGKLKIFAKDGTKATSLDGQGYYSEPVEAIEAIAKRRKMWEMSTGGAAGDVPKTTKKVMGKEVNQESVAALAKLLNK